VRYDFISSRLLEFVLLLFLIQIFNIKIVNIYKINDIFFHTLSNSDLIKAAIIRFKGSISIILWHSPVLRFDLFSCGFFA